MAAISLNISEITIIGQSKTLTDYYVPASYQEVSCHGQSANQRPAAPQLKYGELRLNLQPAAGGSV